MTTKSERSRAMTRKYVALIRKEPGTDYWVDVPDIPGCVSSGETEDEAKVNFLQALRLHLQGLENHVAELAPPRARDDVLAAEKDDYLSDFLVEV